MGGKTLFLAGIMLTLAILLSTPSGRGGESGAKPRPDRLVVIATLFPQFDFARQIGREHADVRLLLPPGAESHSFEPTPADMTAIAQADIFIYTGPHMEPWAKRLADSAARPAGVRIVDASTGIRLDDGEDHDHAHDHGHNHTVDPHIWLNPVMAAVMAENIARAFQEQDPGNADAYRQNAAALQDDLRQLDEECASRIASLPRRTLVFGERFPFAHFFTRYGLEAISPFNTCVAGAEPGLRAVIDVIARVRAEKCQYVYVEAMTTSRMADAICRETNAQILSVDSLHNPPPEKQAAGSTYQSVMRDNLDAFAKGLE